MNQARTVESQAVRVFVFHHVFIEGAARGACALTPMEGDRCELCITFVHLSDKGICCCVMKNKSVKSLLETCSVQRPIGRERYLWCDVGLFLSDMSVPGLSRVWVGSRLSSNWVCISLCFPPISFSFFYIYSKFLEKKHKACSWSHGNPLFSVSGFGNGNKT